MSTAMVGYKRILFASDLAANSRAAFKAAVDVAVRCKAELTILHVFEYGDALPDRRLGDGGELKRLHDEAARRLDEQVRCAEAAGIECEGILDSGTPAEVILETIGTSKSDFVVVGTNALRGIERMVFGSDAEVVLRKAECPVLVVGPLVPAEETARKEGPVVFATDFRPTAVHGMRGAVDYANALGAELQCVHLLPPDYEGDGTKVVPLVVQEALQKVVAEQVGLAKPPVCRVEYCGSVPEGVVKYAQKAGARAIVLGVRQSGPIVAHAAPGIAFRVIASAHCPVLTVAASAAVEVVTGVTDSEPQVLAESVHGNI
jgi:nucleotide-binding universal stress UspA family protein